MQRHCPRFLGMNEPELRERVEGLVKAGLTAREIAPQLHADASPVTVNHWYRRWDVQFFQPATRVARWRRRFDRTHGAGAADRFLALLKDSPRRSYADIGRPFGMSRQAVHWVVVKVNPLAQEQATA